MAFSAGDIDKRIAKLRAAKEEIAALLTRGGHAHLLRQREACAPQREFALKRKQLKELRVACVMDRFTLDSYAPECILKEVTPDGWKKEIASFLSNPHGRARMAFGTGRSPAAAKSILR